MGSLDDPIPEEPGIYFITDGEGNSYVGSSKSIENRRKSHRSLLRNGKHYNKNLQASFDRDGTLELTYSVVDTVELANEIEQNFLDEYYKSGVLLNSSSTAKNSMLAPEIQLGNKWATGKEVSQETRRKISESNKGKVFTKDHKAHLRERKRFPLSIEGVVYNNAHDAARKLGITHDVVKNRVKNPRYPDWKKADEK